MIDLVFQDSVKKLILIEGSKEGGVFLEEEDTEVQLTISEVDDKLSSSPDLTSPTPPFPGDENQLSSTPSPVPALKNQAGFATATTPLSSSSNKRKHTPKTPNPVDRSLELLSNYFENKQSSNTVAGTMGRYIESVAGKMPFHKQLKLMSELSKVVERVNQET